MLFEITIPQFTKMLHNLHQILDKAAHHAEVKKFDSSVYVQARLAPDQLPFVRQIQIVCDTAKLAMSRLTGHEAPVNDDKEATLGELKTRIEHTLTYLKKFTPKDFAGAETKRISQPRWEGKSLSGEEYVLQHVIPNFYFHFATAYAILRHNGVDIGKKDFLGELPYRQA